MKTRFKNIWGIAWKEWLQVKRDVISLLLAIWMPLFLLLLFGTAITLDIKNIPLAILDGDRSSLSREIKDRIISGNYFFLRGYIETPDRIDDWLDSGRAKIVLWFRDKFYEDFYGRKHSTVLVLMDGVDNNTARVASGYFQALLGKLSEEITQIKTPVTVKERVLFNQELKSTYFFIPGLMGIILIITCTVLTAMSIVREKERGTIEILMVTPIRPVDIIIGKMVPYSIIALTSFIIIFFGSIFIFKIPFKGSIFLLFAAVILFIFVSLSYGLFISTLTESQQVAWMISMLTVLLPSMILSGFIFLIPSMPYILQKITYIVPARYIISILRGIILKGNSLSELLDDITPLILMSFGLVYFSTILMKRRK